MMELAPGDADAIRALADGIERGTLTDEERNRSISVLGRAASADASLGRALGVRHTDVPGVRGKIVYRLTALGADGSPGTAMVSAEVDPGKPTPAPGRPAGLRAEERDEGVALFWADPPVNPVAPVVGYRVDREDGGRRMAALTPKPLLLERHLRRGEPEFLDGAAPAKKISYQVRSVDVFGRLSAPARAGIAVTSVARAEGTAGAKAAASGPAAPAEDPAPPGRIVPAASAPGTARAEADSERGRKGATPRTPTPPTDVIAAIDARNEAAPQAPAVAPAREPSRSSAPPPAQAIAPAPAPETPAKATWAAPRAEPPAGQSGSPPPPVIVGIAGMGDRVVVRFKPGEPEGLTEAFVVLRSESPTGPGISVGRPISGQAREWQDTSVSAGQFFWYRLLAVDATGRRSDPSKAKWVSTGSR